VSFVSNVRRVVEGLYQRVSRSYGHTAVGQAAGHHAGQFAGQVVEAVQEARGRTAAAAAGLLGRDAAVSDAAVNDTAVNNTASQ
jgi:hypothetical protein